MATVDSHMQDSTTKLIQRQKLQVYELTPNKLTQAPH